MLVDVHRRGAEGYWFWVILFLQPVGPWAYFFAVRLGDLRGLPDWLAWKRRPALAELRYRAEHMPTLASRLALAERLVEERQYQEALPYLTAVLKQEPELCPALFALAVCHAEDGRPEQAIPLLQQVIARERMWSNYAAWYRLIEVRAALGNGAGAGHLPGTGAPGPHLEAPLPAGRAHARPGLARRGRAVPANRPARAPVRTRLHPAPQPPVGQPGPSAAKRDRRKLSHTSSALAVIARSAPGRGPVAGTPVRLDVVL